MLKRIVKESLVILCGTLFFLSLTATVGIPGKERAAFPAPAASKPTVPKRVSPRAFRAGRVPKEPGRLRGAYLAGGRGFGVPFSYHEH